MYCQAYNLQAQIARDALTLSQKALRLPKIRPSSKEQRAGPQHREERSLTQSQRHIHTKSPRPARDSKLQKPPNILERTLLEEPASQSVIHNRLKLKIQERKFVTSGNNSKLLAERSEEEEDVVFELDSPQAPEDAEESFRSPETDRAIRSIRNRIKVETNESYYQFIKKQDKLKDLYLNFGQQQVQDPIYYYCVNDDVFPKKIDLATNLVDKSMDFSDIGITSKYLPIIVNVLKTAESERIKQISLNSNKLNEWAVKQLIDFFPSTLKVLDLSHNDLGRGGGTILAGHLSKLASLKSLNLSCNFLGDGGASSIFNNILKNQNIKKLNLSENNLTDNISIALYSYLSTNGAIEIFSINWNKLGQGTSALLARAMMSNRSLRVLDISYNRLGQNETPECVQAWVDALSHPSLPIVHLDLSFNQFGHSYIHGFRKALLKNDTLYGLHVEGNKCSAFVDQLGFIQIQFENNQFKDVPQNHLKIDGVNFLPQIENSNDCCWICQGWMEYQFIYVPEDGDELGQVCIHLDFFDYKPRPMMTSQELWQIINQKNLSKQTLLDLTSGEILHQLKNIFNPDKKITMAAISEAYDEREIKKTSDLDELLIGLHKFYYTAYIMCPPNRRISYFYTAPKCGKVFINDVFPTVHISQDDAILTGRDQNKLTAAFTYQDGTQLQPRQMEKVNFLQAKQMFVLDYKNNYRPLIKVLPRQLNGKRILLSRSGQAQSKKKQNLVVWSKEESLFRTYQGDTEEHLENCFQFDWECGQIKSFIKSDYDAAKLKWCIKQFYHFLKDLFKLFSSDGYEPPQNQIFCIQFKRFLNLVLDFDLCDNPRALEEELMEVKRETDSKYIYNPAKALVRFQFVEILFRLSIIKLTVKKSLADFAFRYLSNLEKKFSCLDRLQEWREARLWTKECATLFQLKYYFLRQLFDFVAMITNKKWSFKLKWVSLSEFLEFLVHLRLMNYLSEAQAKAIYNFAMQTQVDEVTQDRCIRMNFVEFFEALGRLAEIVSPAPVGENCEQWAKRTRQLLPLHVKLEALLTFIFIKLNAKGDYQKHGEVFCAERSDFMPPQEQQCADGYRDTVDELTLSNAVRFLKVNAEPYMHPDIGKFMAQPYSIYTRTPGRMLSSQRMLNHPIFRKMSTKRLP